jgi:putative FmdB family regulatory protein
MPIYEYKCEDCGYEFEIQQKITEKPLEKCTKCKKGKVSRLISATAFTLKGGGWYKDGYSKSASSKSCSSCPPSCSCSGKKTEAKTETKKEKKADKK